ncbi:hypothetical protein ABZU32_06160 [Sphaerisporangium sp. NPDC005288]
MIDPALICETFLRGVESFLYAHAAADDLKPAGPEDAVDVSAR